MEYEKTEIYTFLHSQELTWDLEQLSFTRSTDIELDALGVSSKC